MNPTRAILVHGFNVSDGGAGTIDRLAPYVRARSIQPVGFDYGWTGLLGVRFATWKRARELAAMSRFGDAAIGHSNGCNLIIEAAWRGAQFRRVVFINPALDSDAPLPPSIQSAHVWHSPSDLPVRFAKFLWFHPWGDMGAKGFTGDDPRYINHDKENDYAKRSRSHSDVFGEPLLDYFAPMIVDGVSP